MPRRQPRGTPPRRTRAQPSRAQARLGVRLPRSLHALLRVYAAEHGTSISDLVKEMLDAYMREAQERLPRGKRRDTPRLRATPEEGWIFTTIYYDDDEPARRLKSLVALDNTTISSVVHESTERRLSGYRPRALRRPGRRA